MQPLSEEEVILYVTFCANSGFPESLLRCMNSKCRVPYSARILLPPDAHGQFLPIPLDKEEKTRKIFKKKKNRKRHKKLEM